LWKKKKIDVVEYNKKKTQVNFLFRTNYGRGEGRHSLD